MNNALLKQQEEYTSELINIFSKSIENTLMKLFEDSIIEHTSQLNSGQTPMGVLSVYQKKLEDIKSYNRQQIHDLYTEMAVKYPKEFLNKLIVTVFQKTLQCLSPLKCDKKLYDSFKHETGIHSNRWKAKPESLFYSYPFVYSCDFYKHLFTLDKD